jgi:hypothetical protein
MLNQVQNEKRIITDISGFPKTSMCFMEWLDSCEKHTLFKPMKTHECLLAMYFKETLGEENCKNTQGYMVKCRNPLDGKSKYVEYFYGDTWVSTVSGLQQQTSRSLGLTVLDREKTVSIFQFYEYFMMGLKYL